MCRRLGIMGGTFDPVHFGHLRAAEEACEALGFQRFMFMPAADPPHKSAGAITPFTHRARMLRIATQDNPRFELSDLEQRLTGKSYTVITLNSLLQRVEEKTEIYFMVGLDSFLELDTWWHYRDLFQLARIVVLRRPGYSESAMTKFLTQNVSDRYRLERGANVFRHPSLLPVHFLENTYFGISSTQIRQLVKQGGSIRYLTPSDVVEYIQQNGLYRSSANL